ncbi:fungal-specific transcription factor domain-containing protein [Bombardia bombarda]|uniref:Fungal-specific transcription factor domain-containing protein n=1 Tax=Bombardia bombarda TaxID=252184 RepID=A0AA40C9F7_9PEZI|nr:fungal-specific transcription factor domain-containing protein [Bombardia bombarda]
MEENRKRHCWECLRRRLVCDSTRPACKRCLTAGTVCSGYSGVKPARLKWLAPGRVTSRSRKSKKGSTPTAESESTHVFKLKKTVIDHPQYDNPFKVVATTKSDTTVDITVDTMTESLSFVTLPHFGTTPGIHVLIQASEYYNTCIYQDLQPINELGPNPYIYLLSPAHVQIGLSVPDHLRLGMVCMTLSHRINRTRDNDPLRNVLTQNFYRYRGIVIRSLNEDINVEHKRTSNLVIAGVITLLLADVQQGASPNWRFHLEGVQKLIALRGGLRTLAASKESETLLLTFYFLAALGSTTSPASDLLMTASHLAELDFMLDRFGNDISRSRLCPPAMFAEIVKINHLRMRAATATKVQQQQQQPTLDPDLDESNDHLSQEAYAILIRIHAFSPAQWAASKPSANHDWALIGKIYQAALVLYCISSLQSLAVLPPLDRLLLDRRRANARLLRTRLAEALASPRIKRFVLWPLVVLGVEAVDGDEGMRGFVEEQLGELSRHIGTYVPLMGKAVLKSFWAADGGDKTWDVCFDRPYAFSTQLAVEMSGILPVS